MSTSADLLHAALDYAFRDWPVLPCEPGGKRPLGRFVSHGVKDATTDIATIRQWWGIVPDANIGLATGFEFDVLDVDDDAGREALDYAMPMAVRPEDDPFIIGPTVATTRGVHVYMQMTGFGNRAGLLEHVDFRGRGGYVIAPPSVHPSGVLYTWMLGSDDPEYGAEAPLFSAPAWFLELLERPGREMSVRPIKTTRANNAYGQRALESECGKVVLAPVGQRNHTLNAAAFSLGQLIAGGVLAVDDMIDALLVAAERCGLETSETRRTIASGLASGATQPRVVA